ncbi:MAG: chain-length determining protein [Prevotella sp.]|nr:chain-length determining protein [Prevotella sp.]
MEENKINNQTQVIDLRVVFKKIWLNRKLFYKTLSIAFILSCIYILGVPRTYDTKAMLAPEMDNSLSGGTLGSIAASFGFDLSEMQTSDAITPLLYPDLMEDNGFVTSFFNIKVKSIDGEINTTYYDYLKTKQKPIIWFVPYYWIKEQLKSKEVGTGKGDNKFDPYQLSKKDHEIAEAIRSSVKLSIDKKTGEITINTKAQDPLICKTLSDSVKARLQQFITNYRTNKARSDYDYYLKLASEAKRDYEKTRQRYASMADASTNVSLRSVELKMEDMENDMQLKFTTYTTLNTQLQAAKAKVQERTPAFTIIQGAAVPVKPTGPKRMLFVIGMVFLTFIGTAFYLVRKDMHFSF